jgi:hypothetical protein
MERAIGAARTYEERDYHVLLTHNFEWYYTWLEVRRIIYPRYNGGIVCHRIGCSGWNQGMLY